MAGCISLRDVLIHSLFLFHVNIRCCVNVDHWRSIITGILKTKKCQDKYNVKFTKHYNNLVRMRQVVLSVDKQKAVHSANWILKFRSWKATAFQEGKASNAWSADAKNIICISIQHQCNRDHTFQTSCLLKMRALMSLNFQLFTSFISVISMGPFDKRLSQADGLVT